MVNYYDNKSKNLFVMLSVIATFFASALQFTATFLQLQTFGKINIVEILQQYFLNIPFWLGVVRYIIIFVFAITIFKNFKFKKFLLPIYFCFSFCLTIYTFLNSIYLYSKYQMTYSLKVSTIISIITLALLFIGSLNNFKFIAIFKIGLLAQIINIGYDVVKNIFVSISRYFETTNYPSFNLYSFITFNICGILAIAIQLLLPISLLVLVTRKKQNETPNEEPQTIE